MAGNIFGWSQTAAANSNSDSTINWAEGQNPSTVNDSARAEMAVHAGFLADNNATTTFGGTATAYTFASALTPPALATGLRLRAKANATNPGAATLTVTPSGAAAFTAKAIRVVNQGGIDTDPWAGAIQNNGIYEFNYDAAANAAAGAWILLNPSAPGNVLLNTLTASSSASLSDTTSITAAFDRYDIEFENILPASAGVQFEMQFQAGGSFQTTGYVNLVGAFVGPGANISEGCDGSVVNCIMVGPAVTASTNIQALPNSGSGLCGVIHLFSPNSTTVKKMVTGLIIWHNGTNNLCTTATVSGFFNTNTNAVTGLKFLMSSGNITSGIIKIRGVA